jgi:hypothetical protein
LSARWQLVREQQTMMIITRSAGGPPQTSGIVVKLSRPTPQGIAGGAGSTDYFCVGEPAALAALRETGAEIVALRDGYYEDSRGGGVAIWGQGRFWEIRSDPFTVVDKAGSSDTTPPTAPDSEQVEVRRAIFGA